MKAKFENNKLNDNLIIEPESKQEAETLRLWDNCVLTARYNLSATKPYEPANLQIVKEPK